MSYNFHVPAIRGPIAYGSNVAFGIVSSGTTIADFQLSALIVPGTGTNTLALQDNSGPQSNLSNVIVGKFVRNATGSFYLNYGSSSFIGYTTGQQLAITSTKSIIKYTPNTLNVPLDYVYAGVSYALTDMSGLPLSIGTTVLNKVLFIPMDIAAYNVWISGAPNTITQAPTQGMILYWTDISSQIGPEIVNPSPGCLNGGWLTAADTGCIFTDLQQAEAGYAYSYCGASQTCGTACFGICPSTTPSTAVCTFDYDPSLKPTKFPYSCTPKNAQPLSIWQRYAVYFIIAIVALVVVILVFVLVFILIARSKRVTVRT